MTNLQPAPPNAKVVPGHPFFEIIKQAYKVFSYQRPISTGVCVRCCMDPDIEADFYGPEIEDLPLSYVRDWFEGACAQGEMPKETWAYLLPRILEILAADEDPSATGIELSLCRFETGNPLNWSAREWEILDTFQKAYLLREIERCDGCLDDAICMFNLAGWSMQALLKQVADAPDDMLARRFWYDWCYCQGGRECIRISACWESPGNSIAFDFYTSPELLGRMIDVALDEASTPELAAKASAVVNVIEASAS